MSEKCKQCGFDNTRNLHCVHYRQTCNDPSELPAPTGSAASRWTPLNERSPHTDGHYLAWLHDEWGTGREGQAVIAYYWHNSDQWDSDGGIIEDGGTIIAWAEIIPPNTRSEAAGTVTQ